MAHSVSAVKRIRQNVRHRSRNRWRKEQLREAVKEVREKVLHGSASEAQESLRKACSVLDRAAGRGVIHKKTAARTKSRLSARVKSKKESS